jgi:hypothetical protein
MLLVVDQHHRQFVTSHARNSTTCHDLLVTAGATLLMAGKAGACTFAVDARAALGYL